MKKDYASLKLKYLGINTRKEPVIYLREDSIICKSEGFIAQSRVRVTHDNRSIVATLNTVKTRQLRHNEASLSEYAWQLLDAKNGAVISVSHPKLLDSLSYIRSKIFGHELKAEETKAIIEDMLSGQLSDINIAMFIAACANNNLSMKEITDLTRAMVDTGQRIHWGNSLVVDKHCVGGLPGNRTTPIVVAIASAFGLTIPKTSSRAITSPAGTADTMEVFTNVELSLADMRKVVERESGCFVWGGSMSLSPADDLLIRIEKTAELDSEGQMVASILSKKIAAGSNHIVIDVPIGTTAKIRNIERARKLEHILKTVANGFGVKVEVIFTDGAQPVGRGIGPALEAFDILSVLECATDAPKDLRKKSILLAAKILEFSPQVQAGQGINIATDILDSRQALKKFIAICEAQGSYKEIPKAPFCHTVESTRSGEIINIDNRILSRLAKLAGAPDAKTAGVQLLAPINTIVYQGQPLFYLYAESQGQLQYALDFLGLGHDVFHIEAST